MSGERLQLPTVAADGTDPEDLGLYLSGLARYRVWYLRERPADYLARLERLLSGLAEDLAELERLAQALRRAGAETSPRPEDAWLAYGRLLHALVTVLDGTKWVVAREFSPEVTPGSFAEAFALLAAAGALPKENLPRCVELGRLRNRLAHAWDWLPSAGEMHGLVNGALPSLREFLACLRSRYLASPDRPGPLF